MSYLIHSIFHTVQGEGQHAGTPAIFIRFAGCNVWSGREADRGKATAKGICAAWCDTEFSGTTETGGRFTLDELLERLSQEEDGPVPPIIVMTGGEPSLQVDRLLVVALKLLGWRVHIETNGSRELPEEIDWVTLSPKPPMPVVIERADELKCVWPDVDPFYWRGLVPAGRVFLQPRDDNDGDELRAIQWAETLSYVVENPWCRISLQTHKLLGIE